MDQPLSATKIPGSGRARSTLVIAWYGQLGTASTVSLVLSTGLFGSGGGVEREREMRPKRGEGAGMVSGAAAHLMIVASSIILRDSNRKRQRAGASGDLLVRRQETAYIIWPSTHAGESSNQHSFP